jgi:hypothetical protein
MVPSVGVEAAVVADVAGDLLAFRMASAFALAGIVFAAPGTGLGLGTGDSAMLKQWQRISV